MTDINSVAEQIKLERLLGLEADSTSFIAEQDAAATRAFREELSEFFYQRHKDSFQRLAGLSKILPVKLSAKLATTLLGSVLSAGIASELPVDKAAKLADKLPTEFLARLSLHLDPKRASAIIASVDEDHVVAVAQALNAQQEYITLARFVGAISDTALTRIIANTGTDGLSLLKTGVYVEDKPLVDKLVRLLSAPQRQAIYDAACEHQLWPETLSLICHLQPDMQQLMANLATEQSAESRDALLRTLHQRNDWHAFLTAVSAMDTASIQRSLALPALHEAPILKALIAAAGHAGLAPKLAPVLALLSDNQKALLAS